MRFSLCSPYYCRLLSRLCHLRSMWRMVCIAFFGAFAWGAASEVYGAQIIAACKTATKAVQV